MKPRGVFFERYKATERGVKLLFVVFFILVVFVFVFENGNDAAQRAANSFEFVAHHIETLQIRAIAPFDLAETDRGKRQNHNKRKKIRRDSPLSLSKETMHAAL